MTAPSLPQLALSAGASIGRYFSIVTSLPSALLTIFIYTLIASGAWSGEPDWAVAAERISSLGIGQVALLLVVSLAVGVPSHPLQFALVQLLEGYWGAGSLGRALRAWRTSWYRRQFFELADRRCSAAAS